jgi:tRNA threonylcarbamoyladenosine biosynthesis protein TsaE
MVTIISHSPAETAFAGRDAAAHLRSGDVIALEGDLGAGKTQWVKGLAVGLGCDSAVTSPTFTLIHEYTGGRFPLYHIDCYRLETPEELLAIGLDEYLDGRGIVVIEWADKFPDLIPGHAHWIRFSIGEAEKRTIDYED